MADKLIKVKLTGSTNGTTKVQKETVRGLGLRKINSTKELKDTPAVRGMIAKVAHLVTVVED